MKTILMLNNIVLIILFVVLTLFFMLLVCAFLYIRKLEKQKKEAQQKANYLLNQLKIKSNIDDTFGYDYFN